MKAAIYEGDFYSDEFIRNTNDGFAELRQLGPVVWMKQQNAYAVARYDEVVQVLKKSDVFISGKGISISEAVNEKLIGSTVNSDGALHASRRKVTATPLLPKNLKPLEKYIRETAQALG